MPEIWKPIEGYVGSYEVSSLGRIRSLPRTVIYKNGKRFNYAGVILRPATTVDGYRRISLTINNASKSHLVHRLVAIAFLPNPMKKEQVNHLRGACAGDGVKNLEWCSAVENVHHSIHSLGKEHKGHKGKFGSLHHNSKAIVIDGVEYGSYREAARLLNCSRDKVKRLAGLPRTAARLIEQGVCHA